MRKLFVLGMLLVGGAVLLTLPLAHASLTPPTSVFGLTPASPPTGPSTAHPPPPGAPMPLNGMPPGGFFFDGSLWHMSGLTNPPEPLNIEYCNAGGGSYYEQPVGFITFWEDADGDLWMRKEVTTPHVPPAPPGSTTVTTWYRVTSP